MKPPFIWVTGMDVEKRFGGTGNIYPLLDLPHLLLSISAEPALLRTSLPFSQEKL
jgi:hypothetical protein